MVDGGPKDIPRVTPRDALKVMLALAGVGAGAAIFGPKFLQILKDNGVIKEQAGFSVTTVGEVLATEPDLKAKIFDPNIQAVFGTNAEFASADHIIIMSPPPQGKSLILELAGFTGGAVRKKGQPNVFGIEMQLKTDTLQGAILGDAKHQQSTIVVREENSSTDFIPLFPPAESTDLIGVETRGFGIVPSSNGGDFPLLICLESTVDSIIFAAPEQSFWAQNGVPLDLPSQARVFFGPLSFPATDPTP